MREPRRQTFCARRRSPAFICVRKLDICPLGMADEEGKKIKITASQNGRYHAKAATRLISLRRAIRMRWPGPDFWPIRRLAHISISRFLIGWSGFKELIRAKSATSLLRKYRRARDTLEGRVPFQHPHSQLGAWKPKFHIVLPVHLWFDSLSCPPLITG
jgi:hypothetical protein